MATRQVLRYYRKPDSGRSTYKQRERIIQQELTRRLNKRGVVFYNDWSAGAFLTHGQNTSRAAMACDQSWVDMFSPEPRRGYHGAFIELKKEDTRVYLKDGVTLSKDPQIQKEGAFLQKMRDMGHYAEFAIGLEDAWKQWCDYFGWEYVSPENLTMF